MNHIQKTQITVTLLSIFSTAAFGADQSQSQQRGSHQGPPPEAYTACTGKNAGDKSQFTNPWGDAVVGTCEIGRGSDGDKLVLRPDHNKRNQGQGNSKTQGSKGKQIR